MWGGLDFTLLRKTDLNFFRQIKSYSFVANFPQGDFSFTLAGILDRTLLLQKNLILFRKFRFYPGKLRIYAFRE